MTRYDFKFQPYEVLELLGMSAADLNSGKKNAYFDCPFCGKPAKDKKFNVNLQNGMWHCYSCGKGEGHGGGILGLYSELTGKPNDKNGRSEARKEIMEKLYGNNPVTIKVRPKAVSKPEADYSPCGIEQRDAVYKALLKVLMLSSCHKQNLLDRGLTEQQIEKGEYRSMPTFGYERIASMLTSQGLNLKGVPGFWFNEGRWSLVKRKPGYLIPVRDMYGRIQGLQLRLDKPTDNYKYQWLSSNNLNGGAKACCWIAYVGEKISRTAYLIEGSLKAQVVNALSKDMFLVAVPGVNSLQYLSSALKFLKDRGVQEVVNLYDMDKFAKPQVMRAMLKANSKIRSLGLVPVSCKWDKQYKGYDDFLLAKRQRKI